MENANRKKKKKKKHKNPGLDAGLPRNVYIRDEHGNISKMPYRELKDHEEDIILDNIFFGYKHSDIYSEEETKEYEKQARQELKDLEDKLRENPELLLTMDRTTERYVPYVESTTIIPFPGAKEEGKETT